ALQPKTKRASSDSKSAADVGPAVEAKRRAVLKEISNNPFKGSSIEVVNEVKAHTSKQITKYTAKKGEQVAPAIREETVLDWFVISSGIKEQEAANDVMVFFVIVQQQVMIEAKNDSNYTRPRKIINTACLHLYCHGILVSTAPMNISTADKLYTVGAQKKIISTASIVTIAKDIIATRHSRGIVSKKFPPAAESSAPVVPASCGLEWWKSWGVVWSSREWKETWEWRVAEFKGGSVAFGGSNGRITGKGKIKAGMIDFEDVYYVEELKHYNLFSMSQMCDKKNKVLFTDTDCLVLSLDFKLPDENQKGKQHKASCKAKADETTSLLKDFIRQAENQFNHKVKTIRSDNRTKFKNHDLIELCGLKGIKREYSNARTPQQNRVAERKNMTLIEAARTMLADLFLPSTFWIETVNTACYVLNRVLVTKPQNKTPYALLTGRQPILCYLRHFGCHVTILNTIDQLGKFDGKSDLRFLVRYTLNIKGHAWMFDLDYLTTSMNYEPVSVENQANKSAGPKEANNSIGTQANDDQGANSEEIDLHDELFVLLIWSTYSTIVKSSGDKIAKTTDVKTSVQTRSKVNKNSEARALGTIDEEVYVTQPPDFVDPKFPNKVYKVVKALYGLHPAPRAWYATLSTFLEKSRYRRGDIDKTLFIKQDKKDIMLVQVNVDDIIFGSTKKSWCDEFEELMKNIFQISSMGELTFFLGL
nr:ribonuclease H-like domain-containing protein [Tanacetum cinerariifolium]